MARDRDASFTPRESIPIISCQTDNSLHSQFGYRAGARMTLRIGA